MVEPIPNPPPDLSGEKCTNCNTIGKLSYIWIRGRFPALIQCGECGYKIDTSDHFKDGYP